MPPGIAAGIAFLFSRSKPQPEIKVMPLYTLKVSIQKITQAEGSAPERQSHSVCISSSDLTLDETKAMQKELLPVLSSFLEKDDE